MKNTFPGIKIHEDIIRKIECMSIFCWFSPFFSVAIFLGYLWLYNKNLILPDNDILSSLISLALMFILICYSVVGIGCAIDILTESWGESFEDYGSEYIQFTANDDGSVKGEITRDTGPTLAGCGRFFLWITYFVWSIPAYLILRFIKFRIIFSTIRHRRAAGVCQYCGGEFDKKYDRRKRCRDCYKEKDYIRIMTRRK